MKKIFLFLTSFSFGVITIAQNITCDNFNITGIGENPSNTNELLISIQFNGNPSDYIGYPFVSVLTGANGDTIGTGNMFYFGQLGGTAQDYPVVLNASADTSQFTAMFVFLNGNIADTCYFSYPAVANIKQISHNSEGLKIWPNPAENKLEIEWLNHPGSTEYQLIDLSGRVVSKGVVQNGLTNIDLSQIESGHYRIVLNTKPIIHLPFIKN